MEDLDIEDVTNIAGMSILINTDDVETGFDPQKLEKDIINEGYSYNNKVDNNELFNNELEKLTNNFSNIEKPSSMEDIFNESVSEKITNNTINNENIFNPEVDINYNNQSYNNQSYNNQNKFEDDKLNYMTNEEKNQKVIQGAINGMKSGAADFNLELENELDSKIEKIESINSLRDILDDEKIDLSRVPEVTIKNSMEDIDIVLKVLLYKNNKRRYSSLADDGIMLFAHGIEYLFDGKKTYFGQSPDMTDWHKTVRNKLRRMKNETSEVVNNVMKDYNLGAGARIAIELIPSGILYSKLKKSEKTDN